MSIVLVLALGVLVAAEAPAPKSPAAVAAIQRSDAAIKRAEEQFRAAKTAALKQLAIDLRNAMSIATKAGNLDEANALKALLDQTQIDIDATANAGKAQRFTIRAERDWQDACEVTAGATLRVAAEGKWSAVPGREPHGPEGVAQQYHLEARVAEGVAFRVGANLEFVAAESGMLQFRMHDGKHGDNKGSVTVTLIASSGPD
jgi:hypothetical protein